MDFDFTSGDYQAFDLARNQFLDDVAGWTTANLRTGFDRKHVDLFLTWNAEQRAQPLRTLKRLDLEDYLTSWLPRNYLGDSEDAPGVVRSLELTIEFLAVHDQLDGTFDRAASLIAFLAESAEDFAAAMADDANFGLGKSMLSAALTSPTGEVLPDLDDLLEQGLELDDLQEVLDARMEAFNALPFEERKRLTDGPGIGPQPIPLPFTFVPPHSAEVEATAMFADVVTMIDRFVEIAHESGIALTATGNIKIGDARRLVDELATGDDTDGITSSLDLRWLTLVDDLAGSVQAVDRMKTVIRADLGWLDRSATDKATALCDVIVDVGFLSSAEVRPDWLHDMRQLLDDGVPHWLGPGLVEHNIVDVDGITALALEVVATQFSSRRTAIGAEVFDDWVIGCVAELFTGLERFGLLIWNEAETAPGVLGRELASGGHIELTPLGRHVLPEHVRAAGYTFETIAGIEEASPAQLVDLAMGGGLAGPEILAGWRADEPLEVRAQALADHVRGGDSADRLVVFDVLTAIGPQIAGPIVRQLLDSDAGSHAATFLLEHGLATADEVGGFINLTPLVDMLTMASGDPELFDDLFQEAVSKVDGDLLEELWRHDQPETIVVLDAAGNYVTDKALAKRVRRAAHKHRSWLGNQGR